MEIKEISISKKIASLVAKRNGRAYYVGGYVRDLIRGVYNKDIDLEIHGVNEEELKIILSDIGEVTEYGKSFGIYGIKGYKLDIALPRCESLKGPGHRGFDVKVDPHLGVFNAALRRDFTINTLMQDVLTGEIIDNFGGIYDIKNKIIRHTNSEKFSEDSLRVLRAAQFSARFGFKVCKETRDLCKKINISDLSKERVNEELRKALLKSDKPSDFFEFLKQINKLEDWFGELIPLVGLNQNPKYHPEGDVWTHTMMVLDACVKYRESSANPYAFMLLALCHDMGKSITTTVKDGVIRSYNHEKEGLIIAERFIRRLTSEKSIIKYVLNMTENHMRPYVLGINHSSLKSCNRLFDDVVSPIDLINFSLADNSLKEKTEEFLCCKDFLFSRLKQYDEIMKRPYVTGKDLIEAGISPDDYFKKILLFAHKLRLAGIEKEDALRETLAYHKKLSKYGNS